MSIELAGPEPMTEVLTWHKAADAMPDAEITVLMWVHYMDGTKDWCPGWFDGDVWRDACSGGPVTAEVPYWCEPQGPGA